MAVLAAPQGAAYQFAKLLGKGIDIIGRRVDNTGTKFERAMMKVNYTTDYEETYCIPVATAALLNITTSEAIEAIGGNYAGNSLDFYRAASAYGFNPMYDFTAEGKSLGKWIRQAENGRYAVFMGTKAPHCIAIEVKNGKAVIADTLNPDGAEFGKHNGSHPRTKIAVVRKMG